MKEENEIAKRVKKCGCFLRLGPPTVILFFSRILTEAVFTDLIVYRTCLVTLNINASECLALRTNSGSPEAVDLEVKVEPSASAIVMTRSLLESLLPGVLSLFLGPWSDRRGRRPLLLAAFSGFTSMFVILSMMCNWNISPWYLILALIPSNILGGLSTTKLALSCYVADSTSEKDRIVQMTLLDLSQYTGQLLSALIGPWIYTHYGYAYVFVTAAVSCASALAYIYFFVPESVKDTSNKSLRGLYKMSLKKGVASPSSLLQGQGFRRSVICLAISAHVFNQLSDKGYETTEFLFTRARLGWDVQRYAYFCAVMFPMRATGLFLVSLPSRFPEIPDTLLINVGLVSALGGALTRSLTWRSWHFYLSLFIEIFASIVGPVIRSVISKVVPAESIGKVFSLTGILELLTTLGGTPMYILIYSHYLPPVYPSPVYLVSVGFYAVAIICATWMGILIKKSRETNRSYTAAAQDDL